ncbi:hypothetical protein EPN54_05355 [bacterium]|nr:MAG: hypothetical protein EPN54_05355 [bacterium]
MKIAIHQPEFMPWLGFFYKMAIADLYVVFDQVQFKKRYFENRNLIVSPKGETSYIGIPVLTKGRYTQAIMDVKIDNSQDWKDDLTKKILHFYAKAPYFDKYYDELSGLINKNEYDRLIDLNMGFIEFFRKHLGIFTPMLFCSQLEVGTNSGSDLILEICCINKANVYLCGASGRDYLKEEDFLSRGISIEWLDYKCPVYKQLYEGFAPNMSTLDLLFNQGENSLDIILGASKRKGSQNLCIS